MSIEIEKAYDAKKHEDKIYRKWEESGAFTPKIDKSKEPYVISMPPPNATGTLHMGHGLFIALQDLMTRHARMQGKPTLWLPGADHAGIATQTKVEKILLKKNITKDSLGRTKFLKEVDAYVENSRSIIRNQLKKMGASCDWTRERFTLDEGLSNAVKEVFIRMYNDGLIYRGNRIVNWSPGAGSSIADDEVEYKEVMAKMYWIKYGPFSVATTRPETMLGDTAVAVHPNDKRYKNWIGKTVKIPYPLGEFEIIVVADKEVDPKFGTGVVKVTPAHSFVDFEIGKRHDLKVKMVINEKGEMMKNCGKYAGMKTFECRKAYVKDLEKMGLIEKVEEFKHNLSICYRTGEPIEPLISKQWFIDVNKPIIKDENKMLSLKEKSIKLVKKGNIKIIPNKFNKTYFSWMDNLHDWCISRQLWYGHRIPIYYCQECEDLIASKETPKECKKCKSTKFKQDPDTLDTWFSAGLWTFSTLGWPEMTEDFKYFHPTTMMETGYDIIFFWIARMIIMTSYALDDIPFKTVYLHGLVRDREGRKMSKSLDNGIDPLEMINKFGADAVRLSLIIGNTPGNDLRMYEEKIKGYRNFVNKIWNSARFTLMNIEKEDLEKEFEIGMIKSDADKWILTKLQELIKSVDKNFKNYKYSDAGNEVYEFIWKIFCDWYLEISKGEHKNAPILSHVLKTSLKLLHPFTPFVSEKIWELTGEKEMLITTNWPKFDKKLLFSEETETLDHIKEIINKIRSIRAELKVDPSKHIHAVIHSNKAKNLEKMREIIMEIAKLESLEIKENGNKILKSKFAIIDGTEIFLPLKDLIDPKKEKEKIESEIKNKKEFIEKIKNKLENEGFIKNANKEVIESEKLKLNQTLDDLEKLIKQKEELQ